MSVAKAPAAPKVAKEVRVKVDQIRPGDVFSEISHYTFIGKGKNGGLEFTHHGSNGSVELGEPYVESLLAPANQFHKEIEVGKEDKYWTAKQIAETKFSGIPPSVGDVRTPGIRTIWENIHSAQVFTVYYQKQLKDLSAPKLTELREAQAKKAVEAIEKAQKDKKGIANVALAQLKHIQENPVIPYEGGEMRALTGYKVQFVSRDGKYQCVDMLLPKGPSNQRPVNINTIEWLVFNGVKYIVK